VSPALHEDRRRASSFGDDAERYDRSRPSYPAALADDLLDGAGDKPSDVLDVGCGTGIVARLFAARGCRVLGVEADARMAAVARRQGITVEVASFEHWERRDRTFDLLVSGQAWHWIDPDLGVARAAECLRPGGRFAAFWNDVRHRPVTLDLLARAYRDTAPELLGTSVALGGPRAPAEREGRDPGVALLERGGAFEDGAVWRYEWECAYSTEEWLDYLASVSDHHVLPPEQLAALLASVRTELERDGGPVVVDYDTRALTARRR
jgi:SAM-dependent methyltransferase